VSSADADQANIRAWDTLYGDTAEPVWGRTPVEAIGAFLPEVRAALGPAPRLLDAATGEGRHLGLLRRLPGGVCGCDASRRALAKVPADDRTGVLLLACNLAQLPLAARTFDLVLTWDTLETLPPIRAALAELRRVLRPGGLLLCNLPGPDDGISGTDMEPLGDGCYLYRGRYFYRFLEPDGARAVLEGAGFEVLRWEKCQWREEAHAGFRDEPHTHTSNVFLVSRPR